MSYQPQLLLLRNVFRLVRSPMFCAMRWLGKPIDQEHHG
jgi:hypothetical protein